ncbi:pentatricopeptide repeat-containing protein At2g37310-like [Cucurbita pepo subsp. pepo]|uniref:pentatricopeptide repeat-containing protein At2g37310-like n=1 Tax=Cucurbita pepo subsp. pepo TaxID=3664 RepID=UPI000C9D7DA0|nr:pentatricopeptide repeat-containing protein At2g37310-like [Cucurbita pepo subsp. pepo]
MTNAKPTSLQISVPASALYPWSLQAIRRDDGMNYGAYGRFIQLAPTSSSSASATASRSSCSMFCRSREFPRIEECLREILSWNAMVAECSQGWFYGECKELYKAMLSLVELRPNALTAVIVLQACAQLNYLILGMECGSLDYVWELFEEMPEKDEVTYGAMISDYMVHEQPISWSCRYISSNAVHGCRPNTVTLASVLPIFSHFSTLKDGKEIHAYAVRNCYDGNVCVVTAIIDSYAKSGYFHRARLVCDQFKGELDEAWKIFNVLLPEYGIQPLVEHYACMVGVLSPAEKLSDAVDFISKMPIEPTTKVWGALLNGASVAGDVELGKCVFDSLLEPSLKIQVTISSWITYIHSLEGGKKLARIGI